MNDHILGMEIISYDFALRPIVKDKMHRVFTVYPDGRFIPLRVPHCPADSTTKATWDFTNPIGQREKP